MKATTLQGFIHEAERVSRFHDNKVQALRYLERQKLPDAVKIELARAVYTMNIDKKYAVSASGWIELDLSEITDEWHTREPLTFAREIIRRAELGACD